MQIRIKKNYRPPPSLTGAYIEMEIHSFLNKPFITFQPHGKLVREAQPEIEIKILTAPMYASLFPAVFSL